MPSEDIHSPMREAPRLDLEGTFEKLRPYYRQWNSSEQVYFNELSDTYLATFDVFGANQLVDDILEGKLPVMLPVAVFLAVELTYEVLESSKVWDKLDESCKEAARKVKLSLNPVQAPDGSSIESAIEASAVSILRHLEGMKRSSDQLSELLEKQRSILEPMPIKFDILRQRLMMSHHQMTPGEIQHLLDTSSTLNNEIGSCSNAIINHMSKTELELRLVREKFDTITNLIAKLARPDHKLIMAAAEALQRAYKETAMFLPPNGVADTMMHSAIGCLQIIAHGNGDGTANTDALLESAKDQYGFMNEMMTARDACVSDADLLFTNQAGTSVDTDNYSRSTQEQRNTAFMLVHQLHRVILYFQCISDARIVDGERAAVLNMQKDILGSLDQLLNRVFSCFDAIHRSR